MAVVLAASPGNPQKWCGTHPVRMKMGVNRAKVKTSGFQKHVIYWRY
jgi:hypothetical protein